MRHEFPNLILYCGYIRGNHTELFRGKRAIIVSNLFSTVSEKSVENYNANVVKCYHMGNIGKGNMGLLTVLIT